MARAPHFRITKIIAFQPTNSETRQSNIGAEIKYNYNNNNNDNNNNNNVDDDDDDDNNNSNILSLGTHFAGLNTFT